MVKNDLYKNRAAGKKTFALLIDPDKHTDTSLIELMHLINKQPGPDIILLGGSLVFNDIDNTLKTIKSNTDKPVFLFPGNVLQLSNEADGIFLLSLISGRNAEFLIGNHVLAAPKLKKSNLEIVPTGYMLINSGVDTSVSYMSNTNPIPYHKTDIAIATAMAGEMLGLQTIYLEAGSGAKIPVSTEMIQSVRKNIEIPLIVGGGIRTKEQLEAVLNAGADMVVIGTAIEQNPFLLTQFAEVFQWVNQAR